MKTKNVLSGRYTAKCGFNIPCCYSTHHDKAGEHQYYICFFIFIFFSLAVFSLLFNHLFSCDFFVVVECLRTTGYRFCFCRKIQHLVYFNFKNYPLDSIESILTCEALCPTLLISLFVRFILIVCSSYYLKIVNYVFLECQYAYQSVWTGIFVVYN